MLSLCILPFLIKPEKLLADLISFHGNHAAAFTGEIHALA